MASTLWKCILAISLAVALQSLVLSAYVYLYAQREGNQEVDRLHKIEIYHRIPASMTDNERSAFAAAVRAVQSSATNKAISLATVGSGLPIAVAMLWLIVNAFVESGAASRVCLFFTVTVRTQELPPKPDGKRPVKAAPLSPKRVGMTPIAIFCVVLLTLTTWKIVSFRQEFWEEMPKLADYCLTDYRNLIALPRSDLNQWEQYLLEVDADEDPPSPTDPALLKAMRGLSADPEGLCHESARFLVPNSVLKSRVAAARLVTGPDPNTLYILNALDGRLHAVNLRKNQVMANHAVLSPATGEVCFSPDGTTIYATSQNGVLYFIRSSDLQVLEELRLDIEPHGIICDTSGHLLVSGKNEEYNQEILVYDLKSRSTLGSIDRGDFSSGQMLFYNSDDDLLYCSPFDLQPFAIRVKAAIAKLDPRFPVRINDEAEIRNTQGFRHPLKELDLYGNFTISPKGDYAVFCGYSNTKADGSPGGGAVLELKSEKGIKFVSRLPMNHAVAWDHDRKLVFLAFTELGGRSYGRGTGVMGLLDVYSLPDWKKLKSYQLPRPAYQLAWDASRRQLLAALDDDKDVQVVAFGRGQSLSDLGRSSNREQSLRDFREANRVTGPDVGPICAFDFSKEIE